MRNSFSSSRKGVRPPLGPKAKIRYEYEWEYPDEPQHFEWETEDVICTPTNTVHQHYNESDDEPVRLLCCQARVYDQFGFGFKDL